MTLKKQVQAPANKIAGGSMVQVGGQPCLRDIKPSGPRQGRTLPSPLVPGP